MAALMRAVFDTLASLWKNVRADIRLRNLTIYAQWFSLSAAFWLYLLSIFSLYNSFNKLQFSLNHGFPNAIYRLFQQLGKQSILIILPYALLALELPQFFARNWIFKLSVLSWYATPIWTQLNGRPNSRDNGTWWLLHFLACGLMAFLGGNMLISPTQGRILRAWVNGLYLYQLLFFLIDGQLFGFLEVSATVSDSWGYQQVWCKEYSPVGCDDLVVFTRLSFVAMVLFGAAAILYLISWLVRHDRVASRTFGGNGVEPMALMLPGWGPSYQSVGNEAGEGTIRL